jgi:hypothetical protein
MITTTDKADFRRHHQRNWQGSGLSQKAYCQQRNLSYHVFKYWLVRQQRYHQRRKYVAICLVPVHIERGSRSATNAPSIEIYLGSVKVILPHSLPAHYVSSTLSACCC